MGLSVFLSFSETREKVSQCVTCGGQLHPERAQKYNYCMARECQEKNAKDLTIVAVGVNKAAEQYMILDERTRAELASGKYHDQRRGSFGPPARPPRAVTTAGAATEPARRQAPQARRRVSRTVPKRPWTKSQEKLALLYNAQRLRPEEIAQKLGVSTYLVTQIILAARNQGKL
jgi:hypothetical protein